MALPTLMGYGRAIGKRETAMPGILRQSLFALTALLVLALNGPTLADEFQPAPLTAEEKTWVKKIETYLNGLKSVKARFAQASSTGAVAEGNVFLKKPGRMRFEYDPPIPVLMIADGWWLGYYDLELEQVSHTLLSSTPADFLVDEKISFDKDIIITGFAHQGRFISLTLIATGEGEEGKMTISFKTDPLKLHQWSVTDAQGVVTDVTLVNPKFNLPLAKDLFVLNDIATIKQQKP